MSTIEARIRVRMSCGTYVARALRMEATASCTSGEEQAAEACAKKLADREGMLLRELRRTGLADRFNDWTAKLVSGGEA